MTSFRSRVEFLISAVVVLALFLPLMCEAAEVSEIVTYELNGKIVVDMPGWKNTKPDGEAPAVSPMGDAVAFARQGNVYLLRQDGVSTQLTHFQSLSQPEIVFLGQHVSWSPTGEHLVYTRILPFKYDQKTGVFYKIKGIPSPSRNMVYLHTIWLLNIRNGKTKQIVGPMGYFNKLWKTDQLQGASVYEPMFSPDGKTVWFLNAGSLYEVSVNLITLNSTGKPRLVAQIGDGLDFNSPGASKWGTGAQQMEWDKKTGRLDYWIGRFWGSGVSEYGYITWKNGKWGKAAKWQPELAPKIRDNYFWGCLIDSDGMLWVHANLDTGSCWVRNDLEKKLPPDAINPNWKPFE